MDAASIFSEQGMKLNVRPLCDEHFLPMEPVIVKLRIGTDIWIEPAFHCPREGCVRSFESGGYISTIDGSVVPESRNFIGCWDGAMYIECLEQDSLIWRCCRVGCERSRVTDRALRPTDKNGFRLDGVMSGPPDLSSRKGFSRG